MGQRDDDKNVENRDWERKRDRIDYRTKCKISGGWRGQLN